MSQKNKANSAAVIELGSNHISMLVSQLSKGEIKVIDKLLYPINLGHDVFDDGEIGFSTTREISSILQNYTMVLESYGVTRCSLISCSAMREASNRSIVADQIKLHNGLNVEVLEENSEISLIFYEALESVKTLPELKAGNSIIAYIGSGTIGIAVYNGQTIVFYENIPMGSLKMHDILGVLRRDTDDFHIVIEEYLNTILNLSEISSLSIDNLILLGSNLELIAKLTEAELNENNYCIKVKKLKSLYDSICTMNIENIAINYNISEESAGVLFNALCIYVSMLRFCKSTDIVISPRVSISQAMTQNILIPKHEVHYLNFIQESALACTQNVAVKSYYNKQYSETIRNNAHRIFDKMLPLHGLYHGNKLIMDLAAILCEVPPHAGLRLHSLSTFNFVNQLDLFGLQNYEISQVAFLASSIHRQNPYSDNMNFKYLPVDQKIKISKLTAIFNLARALDQSQKQKLENLRIILEKERLILRADSYSDTLLEKWAFEEASDFFKSVFGITPELRVRLKMIHNA